MASAPTRISTARPTAAPAKRVTTKAKRGPSLPITQRWHRKKNLLLFTRQLHVLLGSGTPVVAALESLERQTADKTWQAAITDVRRQVEQGSGLAESMAEHPHLFDRVTRSLFEAGETAGKLPEMLDRIVTLTQRDLQMRNGVVGALLYPAILLSVVLIVLCLTLTVVVPRFGDLFVSLSVPIPPTTQATLAASAFLKSYWWVILFLLAAGGVGTWLWVSTPNGQRAMHTLALRMPVIGNLTRAFITARVVRLIGTLVQSHLPLLSVLELVRGSCGNVHYATLITNAESAVGRGEPVSNAFNDPDLIAPSVYEAFRSGENSGRIAASLTTVADFLDEENDVIVRSLTKILEPLILIVLGALVGLLAVSLFLPLFDLTAMAGEGAGG